MESPRRVDALHVSDPPDCAVLPGELAFVEQLDANWQAGSTEWYTDEALAELF